jgi:hypothetical protein
VVTLKLALASQVVYQLVLFATKIGLCFFYLRIFQDSTSRRIVYVMISILSLSFIPCELLAIFRCRPINYAWSLEYFNTSSCLPRFPIIYGAAAMNILGDVFLMAFVIPRIMGLQMGKKQKASVIFVVSLGLLVVAAAVTRLVRIIQVGNDLDSTCK